MDELLKQMIAGAPNLMVALLAVWWLSRKLDRVLDVLLTLLVDRLNSAGYDEQPATAPADVDPNRPSKKGIGEL